MPNTCQIYIKDMPNIHQRYAKDIPKICQRHIKDIPKIQQRYKQRYAEDRAEIGHLLVVLLLK